MNEAQARLVEMATERIDPYYTPVLECVVECEGGVWYLTEKILKAPNVDSLTANSRVLKYAFYFVQGGARVAFVPEAQSKTPDLEVIVNGTTFFLEVRRFGRTAGSATTRPVEKIVEAVTTKRSQLPLSGIGFVAIDNFDLGLESHDKRGFTHDHIVEALCELERCARSNPGGWHRPSGVIAAAMTSGSFSGALRPPHFVWVNPFPEPPAPEHVLAWIVSSLPEGRIFNPRQTRELKYLDALPVRTIQQLKEQTT